MFGGHVEWSYLNEERYSPHSSMRNAALLQVLKTTVVTSLALSRFHYTSSPCTQQLVSTELSLSVEGAGALRESIRSNKATDQFIHGNFK